MKNKAEVAISEEVVMSKIYFVRGEKVMIDRDLAELYGVETKVFKQAIRRNLDVFPEHFMFELTKDEYESLRSQIVTSKKGRGGTRYLPMAFTEYGIIHAAHVLRSKRARLMSVRITEIFIKMRKIIQTNHQLFLQLEQIREKVSGQEEQIALIFEYIRQLELSKQEAFDQKNRERIGFNQKKGNRNS